MVVLAITCLLIIGIQNYSLSIFMKPITQSLNVTRGALALATTLPGILGGLFSVYAGRLTDKYGPRFLVTACGVFIFIGCYLMSRVHTLWQIYAIDFGPMLIGMACGYVPIISNLSRWFGPRNRGMAIGIGAAGYSLGGTIGPIVLQSLISSYDWRQAYVVLGLTFLVVLVITSQFMRHSPQRMGLMPLGEEVIQTDKPSSATVHSSIEGEGMSLIQSLRTARFWILGIIGIIYCFAYWSMVQHLSSYATDAGIPVMVAASIVSTIAAGAIVGKLSVGFIVGRTGVKKALCGSFIVLTLSQLLLFFGTGTWILYLFAAIFGFAYGGLMTLVNVAPGEFFGVKSVGTILGVLIYFTVIGSAAGPPLFGYIFDVTGTYHEAFLINIVLSALGFILSLILLRLREKVSTQLKNK
jgi:MFS transporter, OFA family, oxalate/formate antiporter